MLIKTTLLCLHRSKAVYEFIKVSFRFIVPFYSHQS